MSKIDFSLYSELIVALLSCVFLFIKKTRFLKLLTLFFVVTFLTELIGAYFLSIKKSNFIIYQFYIVFEYIIIFLLYKDLIEDEKWLKFSKILLLVFIIFWIVIFYNKAFLLYSIIIGSFNVGFLVFLYLRQLLLSDRIINYKKSLPFWVSVGFIVFFLPSIPFFTLFNYMKNRILSSVIEFLTVLMNIIISFGLIWSNREEKF